MDISANNEIAVVLNHFHDLGVLIEERKKYFKSHGQLETCEKSSAVVLSDSLDTQPTLNLAVRAPVVSDVTSSNSSQRLELLDQSQQ